MLPKGNVSKHHARLLYRDGRFIVTDLKSTNGTYVNGRKITQATIVREGDKIYIGDFVLRIEATPAIVEPQLRSASASSENELTEPATSSERAVALVAAVAAVAAVVRREARARRCTADRGAADRGEGRDARCDQSLSPLEQDPDESAPAYAVPGPPRIPSGPRMTCQRRVPSGPPAGRCRRCRPRLCERRRQAWAARSRVLCHTLPVAERSPDLPRADRAPSDSAELPIARSDRPTSR